MLTLIKRLMPESIRHMARIPLRHLRRRLQTKPRDLHTLLSRIEERTPRDADGFSSDPNFVAQIYTDLLRRPVDEANLAHWTTELAHGTPRSEVLLAIITSPEGSKKNSTSVPVHAGGVLPEITRRPIYARLLLDRLGPCSEIVLLGTDAEVEFLREGLVREGKKVSVAAWAWNAQVDLDNFPADAPIVVCQTPATGSRWWAFHQLKQRYGRRLTGLSELTLPFGLLEKAANLLPYAEPLDRVLSYYRGENYLGPFDALQKIFPLRGKTVIEFGPMDGSQTAGSGPRRSRPRSPVSKPVRRTPSRPSSPSRSSAGTTSR